MREGRADGGADGEGGAGEGDAVAAAGSGGGMGVLRRRRQPSSSASAASSSSGRREEEADEGRGRGGGGGENKKQGRRKSHRREAVGKAIRDRLHSAAAAPSCLGWGQRIGGREGAVDGGGRAASGPPVTAARARPAAAWCCVCTDVDCTLQANPSANGKEDVGLRSLLEHNDFYSADCNPHAAVAGAARKPGEHPD